jgi:3-dehydroquinate synthase
VKQILDGLPYPVVIGDEAPRLASALASTSGRRVIVVSDRAVEQRGRSVSDALRADGRDVLSTVSITAGERNKRTKTVYELQTAFLEAGADRGTLIVAVGGGTLTDTVGFAAATFMRGLPWLVVATTVLCMVDAAIGGKTGVDRPEGKNLVGALWSPIGVVADLKAIATLPLRERKTGMAEVVKAAVVGDPPLLDLLEMFDVMSDSARWAQLIARAAAVKVAVVARDLVERGERKTLNLGHTFAHALEHASKFRMTHGAAVALGLRAAGILARDRTGWPQADHRRMLHALRRCGLHVHARGLAPDAIMRAMLVDKKRTNGQLRFVLPAKLGDVRFGCEVPESAVFGALSELQTRVASGGW